MNADKSHNGAPPASPVLQCPAALGVPLRELVGHLSELQTGMRGLTELTAEKLAALSAADTAALQDVALREDKLLRRVLYSEQERNAVLARLAQALRLPPGNGVRLTELANHLPEPLASSLRAKSLALQAVAKELQRKNKIAADVARNLQSHIRGIFAEVAGAAQESQVYGPQGRHEMSHLRNWVDAVG